MGAIADSTRARFLCPNCEQRVPETSTPYDEVLASNSSSRRIGVRMRGYSTRTVSTYGRVWLCGACSAAYLRMVALRNLGHRLLRWGGEGLIAGALLLALLYAVVESEEVAVTLISLPALVSALTILVGAGMITLARLQRRRVARFLKSPNLAQVAAPPEWLTPGLSTSSLAVSAPRRTAENHRRDRGKEQLLLLGGIVGAMALIAVLITLLSLGVQHQRVLTQGYSVNLTTVQGGWRNDGDDCTFDSDGYHLTPKSAGKGISCFAPAGDFSNFDAQATAQVVSGSASTDYGLDFRVGDDLTVGNGYIFEVTEDGRAWIALLQNGALSQLSPTWQFPSGISTESSASHTLSVEARGDTLTCDVDGAQVGSFSDGRFTSGRLGLFAEEAGANVKFMAFSVQPV